MFEHWIGSPGAQIRVPATASLHHTLTKLHFLLYKMQIGFFLYLAKGIANWKRDSESTLMKEKQLYCADPTLGTVETLLGLAKIL